MRGYDIKAVLCLHDSYYRNDSFLREYFADRDIEFFDVRRPPEKRGTVEEDAARLAEWYAAVEGLGGEGDGEGGVRAAVEHLANKHVQRLEEIESMPQRTLDSVWWPFTQHFLVS
jgi:dethiobiotin synthetase/adenosylmethionine--8-amino-7-oxononanoate aminotransferase